MAKLFYNFKSMLQTPFYDPEISYEDNLEKGPFGTFADKEVFENTKQPTYDFFGYAVHTPFGIPAGPLINSNYVCAALDKGFDIATYKTVRTCKHASHPWPNVLAVDIPEDLTLEMAEGELVGTRKYHEPLSITNSFGVPSYDPDVWQEDVRIAVQHARPGQVVVGGFQGTKSESGDVEEYISDFRKAARLLVEAGVKVLEVNLSCPNEGTSHLLCFDIPRSAQVAHAIKSEVGDIPLIVKTAYYKDGEALEEFVRSVGSIADGISAINTIAAAIVNEKGEQALPGEGRLRSGVCGHGIKWAGVQMTQKLKALRDKLNLAYSIIGVGGVTNVTDFQEYRAAGADIVMSATGAMWNPYLAQEVKKSLS
jgi:dihydroorotate dehydrogenase (NAD+) catalytic subunit